jgi:hypothetical protein
MKRLLLLSACILLACATVVQAELITCTATREVVGAYDKVTLRLVGMVDSGTVAVPADDIISTIAGTWTANGGTIRLNGTSSNWSAKTLNDYDAQDTDTNVPNQTWVNMSVKGPSSVSYVGGTFASGGNSAVTSFTEGFSMTTNSTNDYGLAPTDYTDNGFDNTLLGVFYVGHNTWNPGDTIWTGTCGFASHTGGLAIGAVPSSIQIVPEPSTIALLASGLFGLLAYAWRKRK